jgi:hypothetical protein
MSKDADFHAGPMNARIIAAPWHTSIQYNGIIDDAHERMVAIPDYDTMNPDQDGYYVRVDTLQVTDDGEASATSILWDVRELARFCSQTLALLGADHAVERAVMGEASGDEDEDELDEGDEEEPEEDEDEEEPEEDEDEEDPEEDEDEEDPEGDDPEAD